MLFRQLFLSNDFLLEKNATQIIGHLELSSLQHCRAHLQPKEIDHYCSFCRNYREKASRCDASHPNSYQSTWKQILYPSQDQPGWLLVGYRTSLGTTVLAGLQCTTFSSLLPLLLQLVLKMEIKTLPATMLPHLNLPKSHQVKSVLSSGPASQTSPWGS